MARKKKSEQTEQHENQSVTNSSKRNGLPETKLTGVNANNTKSVIVSAILEVHGQVRFGDGTDVNLTITETDLVLRPSDGEQIQKFIFAGSKRRGVDRRTIHELRDQHWDGGQCYIPKLCCECPICWLYGFTGTTQKKDINAKSRVLYATSVSVEEVQVGQNTHSRNQVNEKLQTTAGEAGIHEEQIIVAGVHFPIYTSLICVMDWEIGVFAHAFLENVNSNRYTAASRAQGGILFAEAKSEPLLIIDESEQGVFPLVVPKVPGWENDWQKAIKIFQETMNIKSLKKSLEMQGFTISDSSNSDDPDPTRLILEEVKGGKEDKGDKGDKGDNGIFTVKHGDHVLMTRYVGWKAMGYLRQKQILAKQKLMTIESDKFRNEIISYTDAIKNGQKPSSSAPTETDEETGDESDEGSNE